jgi:hypothetical protein
MRECVSNTAKASLLVLAAGFCLSKADFPVQAQVPSLPANPTLIGSGAPTGSDNSTAQPTMQDVLRMLTEMRAQLDSAHRQIESLQNEVVILRLKVDAGEENSASAAMLNDAVEQIKTDQEVTQSEVKTLQQVKVESNSKYPVALTGIALFNSYVVDGSVDNPELPLIAVDRSSYYPHHSLGATLAQTQLGLHATGPSFWTAHTAAQLTGDFFDGTSYANSTPSFNDYFHLRTAEIDIDWPHTQVTAGLEAPLVSSLSPASFAAVSEPLLAWSGNLWTWLPQFTVVQRVPAALGGQAVFGLGILDPEAGDITGEVADGILRSNLQPGYEARAAWEWGDRSHPFEVGANGYYTRQLFYGDQKLDFWAGTADWRFAVAKPVELSGEFYRGRGIGDLGGGAFKNIVTGYDNSEGRSLDAAGGWMQVKARFAPTVETNAFFGVDAGYADEIREGTPIVTTSPYLYLIKNQSFGANLIVRPRTYLVFSAEYRGMRSWYIYGPVKAAQNITLSMGYIF